MKLVLRIFLILIALGTGAVTGLIVKNVAVTEVSGDDVLQIIVNDVNAAAAITDDKVIDSGNTTTIDSDGPLTLVWFLSRYGYYSCAHPTREIRLLMNDKHLAKTGLDIRLYAHGWEKEQLESVLISERIPDIPKYELRTNWREKMSGKSFVVLLQNNNAIAQWNYENNILNKLDQDVLYEIIDKSRMNINIKDVNVLDIQPTTQKTEG